MASGGRQGAMKAKVVLLGEGAVGKTSIVLRYTENKFNDKHYSTLQASYVQKTLNIGGRRIQIAIWDTAGQERFHALGPIYYRDSHGAIVVYDITDEDSFYKARNWVKELRRMLGGNIALCIVGNKIDLEKNRTVPQKEAEDYAASVGAKHYHTSAKQNKGIEDLFLDLSKRILDAQGPPAVPGLEPQPATAANRRSVIVADDFTASQNASSKTSGGEGGCGC